MRRSILISMFCALIAGVAQASVIELTLRQNPVTPYMVELLETALEAQGHSANITIVDLPPLRFDHLISAGDGGYVAFKNSRRDVPNAIRIDVPLTDGLIGHRVVFLNPENREMFADVQTLADLRATGAAGGFGEGWFDGRIWDANGLENVAVSGEWRNIYGMLAAGNRGIDYFSRGILEMAAEAEDHPDLAVDPYLLLVYPGDFAFFLSAGLEQQAGIIEDALEAAVASGERDRLLREHFPQVYDPEVLNMEGRQRIELVLP